MNLAYRSPAVDRAMEILALLETSRDGLEINEISTMCGVPRSTVYRILNSLQAFTMVSRNRRTGRYTLGFRLLALAQRVRHGLSREDLVEVARPHLEMLSNRTGQASKLSVVDGGKAFSIDSVAGTSEVAMAPIVGRHFPLHAGAASKVLFANLDPQEREEMLSLPLKAVTRNTIVDRAALEEELDRIVAQRWAVDHGEHNQNTCAVAAPVKSGDGSVLAAVSIVYFSGLHSEHENEYRAAVVDAAAAISRDLSQFDSPEAAAATPSTKRDA